MNTNQILNSPEQKEAELRFIRCQNVLSIISNFESISEASKIINIKTNYVYQVSSMVKTIVDQQERSYKAFGPLVCRRLEHLYNLPTNYLSENVLGLSQYELTKLNHYSELFDEKEAFNVVSISQNNSPRVYRKQTDIPLLAFETREMIFNGMAKPMVDKVVGEKGFDINEFLIPFKYGVLTGDRDRAFILEYLRAKINAVYNKNFETPTVDEVSELLNNLDIEFYPNEKAKSKNLKKFIEQTTQAEIEELVRSRIKPEPKLPIDDKRASTQTTSVNTVQSLKDRAKSLIQNINKTLEVNQNEVLDNKYCSIEFFDDLYTDKNILKQAKTIFNAKDFKLQTSLLKDKKLSIENLMAMVVLTDEVEPRISKNAVAIIDLSNVTPTDNSSLFVSFVQGELTISTIESLGFKKYKLGFGNKEDMNLLESNILIIGKIVFALNEF